MLGDVTIGFSGHTENVYNLHACLEEALMQLNPSHEAASPTIDTKPSQNAETAITPLLLQYVNEHFSDPDFCVTSAAAFLGISEYATARLLRNVFGANFRRIINEKRIDLAKNLLLSTDYPVNEIAKQAGYMSTSYFIRVFRESVGITPNQFRQSDAT